MSSDFRERLVALQSGKTPPKFCSVSKSIDALDALLRKEDPEDDTADILRVLIEDSKVSLYSVEAELKNSPLPGTTPAWSSLKKHRDKRCICEERA